MRARARMTNRAGLGVRSTGLVLACVVLAAMIGCTAISPPGGTTPTVSDPEPSASAAPVTTASRAPTARPQPPTPTPVLNQWANQVCAATQGFLDAFSYGEPYGIEPHGTSFTEVQEHARYLSPKLTAGARQVAESLRGVSAAQPAADDFQRSLSAAFGEIADIYERHDTAMRAAESAEEAGAINGSTFNEVSQVLLTVERARQQLPAALQTDLANIRGCILLSAAAPAPGRGTVAPVRST